MLAGVLVLATVAGCEGSQGKASPRAVSTADVAVTAAHGATVRLAGGAMLAIPPGGVSSNGRLSARIGTSGQATSLGLDGTAGAAEAVLTAAGNQVTFELSGTTLARAATLAMPVDPAAVQQAGNAASAPGAVWLAFYNTAAHRWQSVDSRYDPVTHLVSAQVTHLSLWAPFTFAWQAIGTALRQGLKALLTQRATLAPCPGVNGVAISDSGGSDGPVIGCASQASASELTVTITSNRGYAMVVPTPSGVSPGPPEYTDYTGFLRTRPGAIQELGGEYLAPGQSLTYTMSLYGSPVVFSAAASVRTYTLDAGILLEKTVLNAAAGGFGDCILDGAASSGPLPLSAAPGLLLECIPLFGGLTKDVSEALDDYVSAIFFARDQVSAVLDLNGDAQSNFSGTARVTRQSLPLPGFYYSTIWAPQQVFVDPAYPAKMGIDNHSWITIQSVNTWLPDSMTMTGVLNYDTCQPSCAGGQELTVPVQVMATVPQTCTVQIGMVGSTSPEQAYVYSEITVNALSGSPPSFLVGNQVFSACS